MKSLAIVIVIYQRVLTDLPFWQFHAESSFRWIICDNSTSDALRQENSSLASSAGLIYLDMGGNAGLSKAYNCAISFLSSQDVSPDWVVLLDQDTEELTSYFKSLDALDEGLSRIFVPFVHSASGFLSPRYFSQDLLHQTLTPEIPSSPQCAINSGMAIHFSLLKDVGGYDESLFLDYVDYDFLLRAQQFLPSGRLGQLDATLRQAFSGDSVQKSDRVRFSIFCKDLKIFCKKHGIPRRKLWNLLLRRACHLSLSHRSPVFLLDLFSLLLTTNHVKSL